MEAIIGHYWKHNLKNTIYSMSFEWYLDDYLIHIKLGKSKSLDGKWWPVATRFNCLWGLLWVECVQGKNDLFLFGAEEYSRLRKYVRSLLDQRNTISFGSRILISLVLDVLYLNFLRGRQWKGVRVHPWWKSIAMVDSWACWKVEPPWSSFLSLYSTV